jgi:hypothetical protein
MTATLDLGGTTFRDAAGRHVLLRGVNFGGDCKVPCTPDGATHLPTDFSDHRNVSFVGRPAPLDELDVHLDRLRHWGFNCLRLLTVWEAVEHAGPGIYDEAYLEYFAEVCRRAGQRGLHVFVDFHQDAWSRMSGGDGAPGWTFEAAGLDFKTFKETGAAHLMQYKYDHQVGGRQEAYPVMSWSGNYARPANGIMWTLFFAGRDFAPGLNVEGRNIQEYLQDHYFGAMRAIAERVAGLDNVIGFDSLNEPSTGYIGKALSEPMVRYRGAIWSVLDGLALGAGFSRELPIIAPGKGVVGSERFNEAGAPIWLPGRDDPFREAGAWDVHSGIPTAGREDYFQRVGDRDVDVNRDYMVPFFHRAAEVIRGVNANWMLFAEVDPFEMIAGHGFAADGPTRTVNASHWYDLTALVTKRFDASGMTHVLTGKVIDGPAEVEDAYVEEMSRIASLAQTLNGGNGSPTLLGECGIQFDMNGAEAYQRWAAGERDPLIWRSQTDALNLMYNAIDRLLLSSTQWNYTVSNRNDPMIGDGWNQEDLSIWSQDQAGEANSLDAGGRAIEGFCRPFVRAAQGTIISQRFDRARGSFEAVIDVDESIVAPTEIFVPAIQFPSGVAYHADTGTAELRDQILRITATRGGLTTIRISQA